MASFGCRELKASDLEPIKKVVHGASMEDVVLMHRHVSDFQSFDGWWYGCLRAGVDLEALMAVGSEVASIYAATTDAVEAMAQHLYKSQQVIRGARNARHHVAGPAGIVGPFWAIFRKLGRHLISDVNWYLMGSVPSDVCPSKRLRIGFAKKEDLRTVYDFMGAKIQEETGKDPRRVDPANHKAACIAAVRGQQVIMGWEEARPVFVAQFDTITDTQSRLTRVFVPPAFRTRKRLIGAALYKTKFAPPFRNKTLYYFAETEALRDAALLAGYEERRVYRSIVTKG